MRRVGEKQRFPSGEAGRRNCRACFDRHARRLGEKGIKYGYCELHGMLL